MTLVIELTPEQETRLTAASQQRGLAPGELVQEMLTERLPELCSHVNGGNSGTEVQDRELVARVSGIRGKYADVGVTTEDLHRERRADKEREERPRGAER